MMKRFWIALGAVCIFGLSITGLILTVRQRHQIAVASNTLAITRQLAAAGPANLAREQAAARQAGMALGPDQMQAPLPPADQNAAPLYTRLAALLKQQPLGLPKYAEGMDAFHRYTPAQIALVRQTLAARPDVMTLIHQAADRPKCVFVRPWSNGADVLFPEYQPMREAVRLLKTESYLLARDGHYHEAVANQSRGFRIAEHAASDPVLLSYLVGVASDFVALSGMQSILAIAGPNAAVATDVQKAVAPKEAHLSLRRAMAGETGFGCTCIIKMHGAESQGLAAVLAAGGFPSGTDQFFKTATSDPQILHNLIDAWEADYLAHMRVLVIASDLSPSERKAAYATADRKLEQEGQDTSNPTHLFSLVLMPVFSNIYENDTRDQARCIVTLAAAAVLETKDKTGTFPEALPGNFPDPFTNTLLGYRREGPDGFVVYSVGSDAKSDGGHPGETTPPGESMFRYPAQTIPIPADMLK